MAVCCSRTLKSFCIKVGFLDREEPDIGQEELLKRLQNAGKAVGQPWAPVDQREYWGGYAHRPFYEPPENVDYPEHLTQALRSFKKENIEPGVAVELGSGNTSIVTLLLKRGWTVVAVDNSRKALECLKQRISETAPEYSNNVRLVCGKMENFTFPEGVKLIIARNSLIFCDPKKIVDVWDRAYKSLAPGGRIVGNFFPHPLISRVEAEATKAMGQWFTEETVVRGLLNRNGYGIEYCKTIPRYYEFFCQPRSIDFIGRKKGASL